MNRPDTTPEGWTEGYGLAEADAPSPGELDAMLVSLQQTIQRERGPFGWIRARPTWLRLSLVGMLFAALVCLMGFVIPRDDLSMIPIWRIVTVLGSISALFGASVWFSLRPLHRASAPLVVQRGVVAAALIGLAILTLLPLHPPLHPDPSDWQHALPCLYRGVIIGLPAFILLRLFDRGEQPLSTFLAAAAAALSANAALALRCQNDSPLHLLKGHASIGLAYIAVVIVWRWLTQRLLSAR